MKSTGGVKKGSRVSLLLAILDEGFDRQAWHGPNLRGSIRGLSVSELSWRPGPARHNIWEVAVHAAYWKYAARRRLLGEKRGSFPLEGSNWFRRPDPARTWKEDVALLEQAHAELRKAVAGLSDGDLERYPGGGKTSIIRLVYGVAAHDVYHAGQIQLLKRMQRGG